MKGSKSKIENSCVLWYSYFLLSSRYQFLKVIPDDKVYYGIICSYDTHKNIPMFLDFM
jgi:hypothetical protein